MRVWIWIMTLVLLAPIAAVRAGPNANDTATAALELRLREAREQLDAAARQLKELNMELFAMETKGAHGQKPMLGVLIGDYAEAGIAIVGLTPDGGAEAAGLIAGDKLVAMNGHRLDAGDEPFSVLKEVMSGVTAGDAVAVEYLREGLVGFTDIVTQARGGYMLRMTGDTDFSSDFDFNLEGLVELEQLSELGRLQALEQLQTVGPMIQGALMLGGKLRLEECDSDLASYFGVTSGVLVLSPPADDSTLKAGDMLLSLNGEPVESVGEAYRLLLKDVDDVSAEVLRKGDRQTITVAREELAGFYGMAGQRVFRFEHDRGGENIHIIVDKDDED